MIKFPDNFLWGAATSSYQVEGNNTHADWWSWEKHAGKEQSGLACRHYELFEEDFDLAQSLHHNAHRLSIEWSRIEPQEGKFDRQEIQHYVEVIRALRRRNIEPMVTLHHFTNPLWFSQKGGWARKENIAFFLRYCDLITRALAGRVHFWITINEPTIYLYHSYLSGTWPPQSRSYMTAKAVHDHLRDAHVDAYRLIHRIYHELNILKPAVGIAQHLQAMVPCVDNLMNRCVASWRDKISNFELLDYFQTKKALDFIGVNYYSRQMIHVKNWEGLLGTCPENHLPVKKNALGWDIYPEGLLQVLIKSKKYHWPIFITENGICTDDDKERWDYLARHLKSVHLAFEQGVDIRGYLYWSLLDNFEWAEGFAPRFGLIDVDYKTFRRTVRPSAQKFGQVCQTGILEILESEKLC